MIQVDKKIDADPKAIQNNRIHWTIKKSRQCNAVNESMFVLTILAKITETRLTFSGGSVTVLKDS